MIAAKSARMRCVVIPHMDVRDQLRFRAADHLLHSLHDFTKEMLA
jgi:beta-phosphoglucomutase-like phosphatase (HAD superfamily)